MAGAGAGRVVIAGGTGFVGGEVVRLFERLGYETFVISRTPRVNTAKTPALFSEGSKSELKNVRTWDDIEVKLFVMVEKWMNAQYMCPLRPTDYLAALWLLSTAADRMCSTPSTDGTMLSSRRFTTAE